MITPEISARIVEVAYSQLGQHYEWDGFNCIDFVRSVYQSVGLTVPGVLLNITPEDLVNPPVGYVVYLIAPHLIGRKVWSHVAIIVPGRKCIHNSRRLGMVTESSLKEIFEEYQLVPRSAR